MEKQNLIDFVLYLIDRTDVTITEDIETIVEDYLETELGESK